MFYFFFLLNCSSWNFQWLNRCGKSGHLFLVTDLRGNALGASPLTLWSSLCVFHILFLLCWGSFLLLVCWIFFFIMKGYWILSHDFSPSAEMILFFLFHHSFYIVFSVHQFLYVEPSLNSWSKATWTWCNSFNILLNSICNHFAEDFYLSVHKGYWSVVILYCAFLYCSCLALVSGQSWPYRIN